LDTYGYDRHTSPGRNHKCTHVEGLQTRHTEKGPFRKKHQRVPLLYRLQHMLGILDALLCLKTLDELRANAAQEHTREVWRLQFPLDDVMHIDWERRQHDRTIEIAGMVDSHYVGLVTGQVLKSLHDERHAG